MILQETIANVRASVESFIVGSPDLETDNYYFDSAIVNDRLGFVFYIPVPNLPDDSDATLDAVAAYVSRSMDSVNHDRLNPIVSLTGVVRRSDAGSIVAGGFVPLDRIRADLTASELDTSVSNSVAVSVIANAHKFLDPSSY